MRVLIIHNDASSAEALQTIMAKAHVGCDHLNFEELENAVCDTPDSVLAYSGIMMACDEAALDALQALRRKSISVPVLMLMLARNAARSIAYFGAGADDVLVLPINAEETAARLRAILRRGTGDVTADSYELGPITVFKDGTDPLVDGERLALSHREYAIFTHLAENIGRVVSKRGVFEAVYGAFESEQPNDKVVDVYICKLRKKLADMTDGLQFIETVYGRGYKFDIPKNTKPKRGGGRPKKQDIPALYGYERSPRYGGQHTSGVNGTAYYHHA